MDEQQFGFAEGDPTKYVRIYIYISLYLPFRFLKQWISQWETKTTVYHLPRHKI